LGLPVRYAIDAEPQWREFASLRRSYEEALFQVASQTFAPLDAIQIDVPKEEAPQIR